MEPLKTCNCRASKCAKAYCQCYAARLYCHSGCHCLDCLNHDGGTMQNPPRNFTTHPQNTSELGKLNKGCACKKSSCMKKYCECFGAGLVCNELCKCLDCQNTDSSVNRRVIKDLKKSNTENEAMTLCNRCKYLDRVLLASNEEQIHNMSQEMDKNNPDVKWLEMCTESFVKILEKEEPPTDPTQGLPDHPFSNKTKEIIDMFLGMLKELEVDKDKNERKQEP